jgi:hypothetical protein
MGMGPQPFGSRFTLEFQLGPTPAPGEGSLGNRLRHEGLLSAEDLELVRQLNNGVTASLDEPSPDHPIFLVKEEAREALRAQYRPRLEPYDPRHDIWLHYFRPHDVAAWGTFLEPRILRMASDFVARVKAGTT